MKYTAIFALLISTAVQANSELQSLLDVLKDNGTISHEQYQRIINEQQKSIITDQIKPVINTPHTSTAPTISVNNGLKITSADKQSSFKVGGRVEVHASAYNDDGLDMGDGTSVRRARIYIKGKAYQDWGYKFDYDFAAGDLKGIKDAFVTYNGFDQGQLITGNYKVPYSLEFQASSHANTFIERSLAFAFKPDRHIGVGYNHYANNWTLQTGLFGDKVANNNAAEDGEWLIAARTTWLPYSEGNKLIHLGAAVLTGRPGDDNNFRYKTTPESKVTKVNLIDTGIISNVDSYTQSGLEASLMIGKYNFQGEYMALSLEQASGGDLNFDGWYIQSSWFLTEDSRSYKKGRFTPVKPSQNLGRGGSGAWEVALRYSSINLNDGAVLGGKQQDVTVGLNVYATPEIRFSAEYINVLNSENIVEVNPELVQLRMEWVL